MALALLYRSIHQDKPALKLLDAAAEGRTAAVLRELESGTSVNSTDRRGWTPLMYAIAKGDLTFARALVVRHADVNAQNSDGVTALLIAVRDHRLPEAEMLIANGAKVEIAEDEGRTALITAAMQSDLAMCKLLLDHGAGPSHRDQTGKTALDYAREERNPEVVALLSAPPTPAR
jgi:ankyrin repeat protein